MTIQTEILADNPTAYWQCDETSGTALNDSSGNGHHLTLAGTYTLAKSALVPTEPGKKYILFTGVAGSYGGRTGTLGITTPVNGDYTLEAIIACHAITSSTRFIITAVASGETEATNVQFSLTYTNTGLLSAFWEHSAGTNVTTTAPAAALREGYVYHLVIVKDGTANTLDYYINGIWVGQTTYTNEPTGGSSTNIRVGGDDVGSASHSGLLGEVAVYSGQKLSASRIAAHAYAAGLLG